MLGTNAPLSALAARSPARVFWNCTSKDGAPEGAPGPSNAAQPTLGRLRPPGMDGTRPSGTIGGQFPTS